jgi:hypothetical protein
LFYPPIQQLSVVSEFQSFRASEFQSLRVRHNKRLQLFISPSFVTVNRGISLDRKDFFLILLTVPESSLSWLQARVQDKF